MLNEEMYLLLAVELAYVFDLIIGDPVRLPHPIVWFGKSISWAEKRLNKGNHRLLKGGITAVGLIGLCFLLFAFIEYLAAQHLVSAVLFTTIFFFYGLANKTLIKEGKAVFDVLEDQGLEAGRKQLSRIVGRDTSQLSAQQIKKAALETMAENLSDGVVAPVFWFALLGIPGMMAYKMTNTLDSMIGYKNERYLYYGRVAAYMDDVLNYIPARITALLMVLLRLSWRGLRFIARFGRKHSSPNAGYPEAALAGILNVQFGGSNYYHGQYVDKPYIGEQERPLVMDDVKITSRVNHGVTFVVIQLCVLLRYIMF